MTSAPTQPIIPGILGLAVNEKREWLITLRNQPEFPRYHRHWQVPGGGMELGEQPEDTLKREMIEELNVTPNILSPYPIAKVSHLTIDHTPVSILLLCFVITIGQQIPKIGDPESLEYAWVKKDELYRLKCLPLTTIFIDEASKIMDKNDLWPQ